jgi:SAM-dependent methyltransferase
MVAAKRYFAWQWRLLQPMLGKRVIEAGCGTGSFTVHLVDLEEVLAVDTSAEMVNRTRMRLAEATNISVERMNVASPEFPGTWRGKADSCVALNLLEHVDDDAAAVRQMGLSLRPGGKLVIFVPAVPALYGPVDANLGHVRRYTRARLTMLAEAGGLTLESIRRVNLIGFFGWWANAKVFRVSELPAAQIRFFDAWIVPIAERMERWFEPPIGQSLLLIARKPEED